MTGPGSSQVQQAYHRKTGWIAPVFKQLSPSRLLSFRIQSCETQIDSKHGPGLVVFLQIKTQRSEWSQWSDESGPNSSWGDWVGWLDGASLARWVPRSLIGIEDTLPRAWER